MAAATARDALRWRWALFYAGLAGAWALLAVQHVAATRAWLGASAVLGADAWRALCAGPSGYAEAAVAWIVMALGMMAPAALPMLRTYDELAETSARRGGGASARGFWALFAGFLAVWCAFSFAAAGAQLALQQRGLSAPDGSSTSRALTATLLIAAGLYQLTPLKHACLRACRAPLVRFLGDWRPDAAYALRKGVAEGALCLACCWALMSLALAFGAMNLAFMGLATALMIAEKTGALGRRGSLALGAALCGAGLWTLA